MTAIILNALAGLWPYVLSAIGGFGFIAWTYFTGKKQARREAEWRNLTAYSTTRKAIDNETADHDLDAARKRMRVRAGKP